MTDRMDTTLSPDDLVGLIELQFTLVAQTAAELMERAGKTSPFRISAQIDGRKITAIIGAEA